MESRHFESQSAPRSPLSHPCRALILKSLAMPLRLRRGLQVPWEKEEGREEKAETAAATTATAATTTATTKIF